MTGNETITRWRHAIHHRKISKRAKLVAYTLSMFINKDTLSTTLSDKIIAKHAGYSNRDAHKTIKLARDELRRHHLIRTRPVKRDIGYVWRYTIGLPDDWQQAAQADTNKPGF